jgi:hypothetical protein
MDGVRNHADDKTISKSQYISKPFHPARNVRPIAATLEGMSVSLLHELEICTRPRQPSEECTAMLIIM